jgi:hypothetical protein
MPVHHRYTTNEIATGSMNSMKTSKSPIDCIFEAKPLKHGETTRLGFRMHVASDK